MASVEKQSVFTSIGAKILGIALVGNVILGGVGLWQGSKLQETNDTYSNLLSSRVLRTIAIDDLSGQGDLMGRLLFRMLLQTTPDQIKATEGELLSAIDDTQKYIDTVSQGAGAEDSPILSKVAEDFAAIKSTATKVRPLAYANDIDGARKVLFTSAPTPFSLYSKDTNLLLDWAKTDLKRSNDKISAASAVTLQVSNIVLAIGFAASLAIAFFVSRTGIVNPVNMLMRTTQKLVAGEFAITVPGASRNDEIGALARASEVLRQNLARAQDDREAARRAEEEFGRKTVADRLALADRFQREMGALAEQFGTSSAQVADAARNLSATAEETSRQSSAVSSSAEEAASNVQTVASAAEQLSASVREINGQVSKSATVADAAYNEARQSADRVRTLSNAAQQIGDVVNLIKGIAEQTNLLALNATIEAARAGEAGRGFAVVASEVKQLASQTAKATDDIAAKVQEIQNATGDTVQSMQQILTTITSVREISGTIAAAVEEQGAATGEIAENCKRAADGTSQVTGNIAGVGHAAEMTGTASTQLMGLSSGLQQQAGGLKRAVEDFVRGLKAA